MVYLDTLKKIEELKEKLYMMRPLSADALKTIREKFRIEYNYHSNHLEGNSLTYNETWTLLMFDIVNGDKKKRRDYEEMKGHDAVIRQVGLIDRLSFAEDLIKDTVFHLTEMELRSLHTMMLRSDYEKKTYNPETNQYLVQTVKVGQYKHTHNHVKKADGTIFYFADPVETPALMQELIEWTNRTVDANVLHPLEIASLFHYKFIRIHPFSDGNGRVARLIVNMILMHFGYPTVVVSSDEDEKQGYYTALEQTDALVASLPEVMSLEDPKVVSFLTEYLGGSLERSLYWMIQGAQGEKLLDADDVLKDFEMKLEMKEGLMQESLGRDRMRQNGNARLVWEYILLPVVAAVQKFSTVLAKKYKETSVKILTKFEGGEEISGEEIGDVGSYITNHIMPLYTQKNIVRRVYVVGFNQSTLDHGSFPGLRIDVRFEEKEIVIEYVSGGEGYTYRKMYGDVSPIKTEVELMRDLMEPYEKRYALEGNSKNIASSVGEDGEDL